MQFHALVAITVTHNVNKHFSQSTCEHIVQLRFIQTQCKILFLEKLVKWKCTMFRAFVFVSVAKRFVRGEGKGGRGGMESWRGRGHTKRRGGDTTKCILIWIIKNESIYYASHCVALKLIWREKTEKSFKGKYFNFCRFVNWSWEGKLSKGRRYFQEQKQCFRTCTATHFP